MSVASFGRACAPASHSALEACLRPLQFASKLTSASFALVLMLACSAATFAEQQPASSARPAHPHDPFQPAVTGTGGAQTGVATFQGNYTTISAPGGSALVLGRKADCSLGLATGTYTLNSTLTYTQTELLANYEQTLHTEAGLTTTPDVFSSGCAKQPPLGFGSKPGVFLGTTTSGIKVFAGIGLVQPSLVEGIYLLTGNTTFSISSFAFNSVGNLATGDLNKDGNGDLIVTDNALASAAHVTVFLGNADGTVQNGVAYPIAGNYSVAAVVDDVNGDGKPDIVAVSGDQQISVLTGKGDGTFNAAQSFAAPTLPGYANAAATPIVNLITADLRGIGKKDVIASNGLVLLGKGDGTFTPTANPAFPYIINLTSFSPTLSAADINKDGKLDLVVDDGDTITTWIGKGDGSFSQGLAYATINQTGFTNPTDLDGDGNMDIFVGLGDGGYFGGDEGSPNLAYALMGNGDGSFAAAPAIPSGAYTGTNLGDVNGDGVPDVVTVSGGTFTIQTGNGKGSFLTKSTFTAPASFTLNSNTYTGANTAVSAYAVGDINGDGKADIVFVDNNLTQNGTIQAPTPIYFVALSNGDGTFQAPTPHALPQIAPSTGFDVSATVSSVQIADLHHNGRPDLIFVYNEQGGGTGVTNAYNQGYAVLPGNGDGTFQSSLILTSTYSSNTARNTAATAQIAAITDVNNDSKLDLAVVMPSFSIATGATTQLLIYLGNNDGTFQAAKPVTATGNPIASVEIADFNKDGKPDLAFLSETSSSQAELIYEPGNADGTFGTATTLNLTGGDAIRSASLAAADFDADGKLDLALLNNNEYSGIFYGNGDGTFSSVNTGSYVVPKDLLFIVAGSAPAGSAIAVDLNKDGKPDILDGNVILLNDYGATAPPPVAATPVFTPAAGTYSSTQSVTITDATPGASIYYTTNGSTPTTSSTKYTAAISVSSSETLEAIATASGYTNSAVASAAYVIQTGTVATPVITPAGGSFSAAQSVTITDSTSGASIYYTTDGSTPTTASTKYTAAINVAASETIKAIATATGLTNSSVASASFTITLPPPTAATPTFTPAGGSFTAAQSVTIADTTAGAVIYYTTDGSTPTTASTQYTAAINVAATETIKAIAAASGYTNSAVASATYTITLPPPDFSVSISPSTLTLSSGASGTAVLTVTPVNGFNAQVSLACSGLPANTSCSFAPASVTPAGSDVTSTLTVDNAGRAANDRPRLPWLPETALALLLGGFALHKRRKAASLVFALSLITLAWCAGCTSGGSKKSTTTVTVTATAGSTVHSTNLTLNLN